MRGKRADTFISHNNFHKAVRREYLLQNSKKRPVVEHMVYGRDRQTTETAYVYMHVQLTNACCTLAECRLFPGTEH